MKRSLIAFYARLKIFFIFYFNENVMPNVHNAKSTCVDFQLWHWHFIKFFNKCETLYKKMKTRQKMIQNTNIFWIFRLEAIFVSKIFLF